MANGLTRHRQNLLQNGYAARKVTALGSEPFDVVRQARNDIVPDANARHGRDQIEASGSAVAGVVNQAWRGMHYLHRDEATCSHTRAQEEN